MTRRQALHAAPLAGFLLLSACRGSEPSVGEATSGDPPPEVSVTVTPVRRTTFHAYVTGWGKVDPESATRGNPPASAAVAAPVAGLLGAILASEGEQVRQGATIFRLDSRVADVAVERAQQAVQFAEVLVQRQERLGPGEATSQRAYQEAKQQLTAAQSELRSATVQRGLLDIAAPIGGTVTRVNAKLGDAVDPSKVLAEIIDLNRLVVNLAIRSVDAQQVRGGQHADLSPGASPGSRIDGTFGSPTAATIEYIASQVDASTDTVLVRARVPLSSGLRPGQFVNARIAVEERPSRLAVPVESVVQGADGPEVAIVREDLALKTRVVLGLREGGLVEVESGDLREGLSVVVRGAYSLPSRTKVKVINE